MELYLIQTQLKLLQLLQHPNDAGDEEPGLAGYSLTPEAPSETENDLESTDLVDETETSETTDYSKLLVSEIKAELDNRGIDYEGVSLKNDLIQLLIDDDNK